MRISTSGLHHNALVTMLQQQTALSKIQNQIATGKRIRTPADDPAAAVHILELERALQEAEQLRTNADMAKNRLSLEEQSLQDVSRLLDRVRELAIQANNAPIDMDDRRMIATELRERLKELVNIANRRDANNEFLFAGYATQTQPFSAGPTGIVYAGDQGNRVLQVGPNHRVADSHSGFDVFLNIPEGNGTFVLRAAATNTGSGVLGAGSVIDRAAWSNAADDYTIHFTSDDGEYEILDSGGNVVTTGQYVEHSAIEFNGIKFELTGMPAQGDRFEVARSRSEDIFTTLQSLIDTLEGTTASNQALFNSNIAQTLQQLDIAQEHFLQIRADIGARLSGLEAAEAAREDRNLELKRMKSELEDLDYAEAVTRMYQQLAGLQAAQASYMQIAQLSLFNWFK
ncbi:MAG: flagellar hook-associated protein FlgL [Gammaproteobacteria bacterium]|nr:flagellar hook-associated protein 3 [Gammaproteobacteria bacterium]